MFEITKHVFLGVFHSRFLIRNDMKITTKVGTIAQVFSTSIKKCDGVHNKKRATILIKTYVLVLFYRITQVNHVQSIQSIDFGLFILLHQLTSSKLS